MTQQGSNRGNCSTPSTGDDTGNPPRQLVLTMRATVAAAIAATVVTAAAAAATAAAQPSLYWHPAHSVLQQKR